MFKLSGNLVFVIITLIVFSGCNSDSNNYNPQDLTINDVQKTTNHIDVSGENFFQKMEKERPTKYITIDPLYVLSLNIHDYLNIKDSYGKKHRFKIISKKNVGEDKYRYEGVYINNNGNTYNDLNLIIYTNKQHFSCSFSIEDGTEYVCYTQSINGKSYGVVIKAD